MFTGDGVGFGTDPSPGGGSAEKPVGLVWFALVDDAGEVTTHRGTFPGNRNDVLTRATMTALSLIWRRLEPTVIPSAVEVRSAG